MVTLKQYVYCIEFRYLGRLWIKFGAGKNGRWEQVLKSIASIGTDVRLIWQENCHSHSRTDIESYTRRIAHKDRKNDLLPSNIDGSTEVWPAEWSSRFQKRAQQYITHLEQGLSGRGMVERSSGAAIQCVADYAIPRLRSPDRVGDYGAFDGALSNPLIDYVDIVEQIEIDFPSAKDYEFDHRARQIPADIFLYEPEQRYTLVTINPPFSDRKQTGSQTSNNGFARYVARAKQFADWVIFIAPQTWESALGQLGRDGIYEVLTYDADFGEHPNASVISWRRGEFRIIGGRDSRKPQMPKFDVEVLPTRRQGMPVSAGYWGVSQTFKLLQPGDTAAPMATLLRGNDAEACARWIIANREALTHWWGCAADGMERLQTSQIRKLLQR